MKSVKLKTVILTLAMSSLLCMSAFAAPTDTSGGESLQVEQTSPSSSLTLDELKKQAQETQAVLDENSSTSKNSLSSILNDDSTGNSSINGISGLSKLDNESSAMKKVGGVMNSFAGKLVQILGYVLSIGLGVSIILDLVYLSVTPLRSFLASPTAQPGSFKLISDIAIQAVGGQAQAAPGGQMNTSGFNTSGFNSRFNGSGFGGPGFGGPVQAQQAQGQAGAGIQNPIKIWFKGRVIDLILAPTIFVLAATGILTQIGFWIGQTLTGFLSGVPNMI